MRKIFIGLLVFFSLALVGVIGYILYSTSQQDVPGDGTNTSSTSFSSSSAVTSSSSITSSSSTSDIPVAEEDALVCGAEGSDLKIDFENLASLGEGGNVFDQFAELGITFRNGDRIRSDNGANIGACDSPNPKLVERGEPQYGFQPSDSLSSQYLQSNGQYFITDSFLAGEGARPSVPCQLIIDFTRPTYEFSFELLDVDGNTTLGFENWRIQAYDQNGNQVAQRILNTNSPGTGNAMPTSVTVESTDVEISRITVTANTEKPGWGLAFDNFQPYCVDEPPTPLQISKNSTELNVVNGQVEIDYTVTVNNPDDAAVEDVIVTDVLPSYVNSVNAISNGGSLSSNTITWNISSIASGASVNLTYTAVFDVDDLPQTGGGVTISNTATVYVDDNGNGTPDDSEEDDTVTEETEVDLDAAAQVVKSVAVTQNSAGAAIANYTIRVSNTGDAPIANYTLRDIYDSSVQAGWISNISNGGVESNGQITWANVSIPVGGSVSFTYTITIPAGTEMTLQNVATLYDENDEPVGEDTETILIGNDLPQTGLFDDSRTLGLFMIGLGMIMLGLLVNRLDEQLGLNLNTSLQGTIFAPIAGLFRPYEDRLLGSDSRKRKNK